MLVLTRRLNESVDIGDSCKVTVDQMDARDGQARLTLTHSGEEFVHVMKVDGKNKIYSPPCEVHITLVDVSGNQVKLGFKAPSNVQILRSEVIDDGRNEEHF